MVSLDDFKLPTSGGIDHIPVWKLDSIFETHRSNEAIATLEQRVINHEKAVQRQAELAIQQQRLTEEQTSLSHQLQK